jgi:hypothetical protein
VPTGYDYKGGNVKMAKIYDQQTASGFKIWKTIKLGTGLKTADDFRNVLKKAKCQITNRAGDIMNKFSFAESLIGVDPEERYDLVFLTTAKLTGINRGTIAEVFVGAERLGLKKCPAWMGPKLRSEYQDQPSGEWVLIGMKPIIDSVGRLHVFRVRCYDPKLWLDDYWSDPVTILDSGSHWVFCLPRK